MSTPFDPEDFLNRVGKRLVAEFDDASQAGTSGLIGAAREHPARKSLERLLPGAVTVGSGIVIDSYGSVSRQQDIILYEQALCPVFSVNDTPEATFFPCEGVIAVGEVKSALDTNELTDSFEKIASVKRLRRHAVATKEEIVPDEVVCFRKYGSPLAMVGTKEEEFDQAKKSKDQIYGFLLCGQFKLKIETIMNTAAELWKQYPKSESPNLIVSLQDGFLQPFNQEKNQFVLSTLDGDSVAFSPDATKGVAHIIGLLNTIVRIGRTVEVEHFKRYFLPPGATYTRGLVRPL